MKRRFWLACVACLCLSCSPDVFKVTTAFESSVAPKQPDYSNPDHWAALPTKRDAADSLPRGIPLSDKQVSAKADVFFIYPTIYRKRPSGPNSWNADVEDVKLNEEIQQTTILNQASVFNGSCQVYAPYYRQAHLYAFYSNKQVDGQKALDFAYQDVKAAFEYYLKHYNKGRPIVIASHSQGSYHAERLLKDFFDGKELGAKLVVAYLVGRAIKPNTFEYIRVGEGPTETGVWYSWNTFARDHYPENYKLYFEGAQSSNPLLWNSTETFASKELNKGGVGPKFKYIPQLADAQNQAGMLWINKPYIRGRAFIRTKRWHYADINLFYMNIRENVEQRISTYWNVQAYPRN